MHLVAREYVLRRRESVERGGKTGIDRHLNDDFDDFFACAADAERTANVHLELRARGPQCRQCRHRRDLAGVKVETGTRVDVAERKLDEVSGKVGCDVAKI